MDKALVFFNGDIITMDPADMRVEAAAVCGTKVTAVGSPQHVALSVEKGIEVEHIDLQGATLLPGFYDTHCHLFNYALNLKGVDLTWVKSAEELKTRLREYIARENIPAGEWVLGRGWNQELFYDQRVPPLQDLDSISMVHPILLIRVCTHVGLVNSMALAAAGICRDSPNPSGGQFERDKQGSFTGIVKEMALECVKGSISHPDLPEMKDLVARAAVDFSRAGLTSIQSDDLMALPDLETIITVYSQLEEEGRLPFNVALQLRLNKDQLSEFIRIKEDFQSRLVKPGPLKIILDGSLGARTAALRRPYRDAADPDWKGILTLSRKELTELLETAHANGLQTACHCIGDAAAALFLNVLEDVKSRYPEIKTRHRMVHCQVTDYPLLDRIARAGIAVDIQPLFTATDWPMVDNRIGPELAGTSYAWKSLLKRGVPLAGSSDCPVESFRPLDSIQAAVTRQDLNLQPPGGWHPAEKLSIGEGISLFTSGAAEVCGEAERKGMIRPGMDADFVILEENPFRVGEHKIRDIQILGTVVQGKRLPLQASQL